MSAEQLDRYFANELPLPEAERVRSWLAANPEIAERARAMRDLWTPPGWTTPDLEQGWRAITAELRATDRESATAASLRMGGFAGAYSSGVRREASSVPSPHLLPSIERRRQTDESVISWQRRPVRWGMIAFATVCLALASVGIVRGWMQANSPSSEDGQWKLYRTARGQHAELRLADGTKVTLAPESRLQVRQDGALADREVELSGQAFFAVIPHTRRPFVVRTQHGVTEELGTSFSVTAYPGDTATRVVVAEGRVAMWADTEQRDIRARTVRVLAAGEFALISAHGVSEFPRKADLTQELRWLDRELIFQSASLGSIMDALERWYDVRVTYADPSVRRLVLTVTVTDDPIDETLRVITRSLNLRFERHGNVVRILGTFH